ncbi:MAG: hypothetical protein AMXMBFR36_04400 [Acidobacteriota bacterium]
MLAPAPRLAATANRRGLVPSLARIVAGGALYGAALGSWHGPRLALYTALKLPLLLVATALATAAFQGLIGRALGLRLGAGAALRLSLRGYATTALLLGSLAPVALLFVASAPPPGTDGRTAHNLLYLTHTSLVAACGLAGLATLRRELGAAAPSRRAARIALVAWVTASALVGGELAWALRPFVGSVYEPVAFLRIDALDGNVYEFVWTDILPHLAGNDPGERR